MSLLGGIKKFNGTGTSAVHFGLFLYATVANIEINSIENSNEDAFGFVAASNS